MNAEEAMLEFMGRPEYVPMKLEAIMHAIGGDKSDLRLDLRLSLAASGEERSLRPVLRAVRRLVSEHA